MSQASDAYAEAERRIAVARETEGDDGLELLDLESLVRIPGSISSLLRLDFISLTRTQVTDLSPLAGLPALATVYLSQTRVTDLSPLAHLPSLTSLRLTHSSVTDLTPLAQCLRLATLDIQDTQVTDLTPLAQHPSLETLDLGGTPVTDLGPLAYLPALTTLKLTQTPVTDLAPLAFLPALDTLNLAATQVTDLSPLAQVPTLSALDLSHTLVTDLSPLAGLSNLHQLELYGSAVTSDGFRPLGGMQRLISHPGPSEQPEVFRGLNFAKSAAAQSDPRIAQIAAIEDPSARARALFEHLGLPVDDSAPPQPNPDTAPPEVPAPAPAPLETEIADGMLVRADRGAPSLPDDRVAGRARKGWQAIRDFRDAFVGSINLANYRPLAAAMAALDRALGSSYDQMNEVGVGLTGRRLEALSQDRDFVGSLPDGSGAELASLSAAVATFANRFPEWLSYLEDAERAGPVAQRVQDVLPALDDIAKALDNAGDVAPDVAQDFRDQVERVRGAPASEDAAKGLLASTRELLRTLAEDAVMGARLYAGELGNGARAVGRFVKAQVTEFGAAIPGELRKKSFWAIVGIGYDIIMLKGANLLALAHQFPPVLGWIEGVLKFLGVV